MSVYACMSVNQLRAVELKTQFAISFYQYHLSETIYECAGMHEQT